MNNKAEDPEDPEAYFFFWSSMICCISYHYSRYEMQQIIDDWQHTAHMKAMSTHNVEDPDDE